MRHISIGFPSGQVELTLYEGTEDEKSFQVRCAKRGKPYVIAYGIKYELTQEETNFVRNVLGMQRGGGR